MKQRIGPKSCIHFVLLLAFYSIRLFGGTLDTGPKAHKIVASWIVLEEEKGFERIARNADILRSLSVFGEPPPGFIDRCHGLGMEVYRAVVGGADAFDSPGMAEETVKKYVDTCRSRGFDGIDLDFENLDPGLQDKYSDFLKTASAALHRAGKKLSHCVGFYPGMELDPPRELFYDPEVVAGTCDLVRVMCYDMYWAPGWGNPEFLDRPDTQGIGPTSSYPFARSAMSFWLKRVPREKLVMGLPAYSNDYAMSAKGRGKQVYAPAPLMKPQTPPRKSWLWNERIAAYLYADDEGTPHLFYASDAESTKAHFQTADELGIPGIGFWHFSSVDDATWTAVREWAKKRCEGRTRS